MLFVASIVKERKRKFLQKYLWRKISKPIWSVYECGRTWNCQYM